MIPLCVLLEIYMEDPMYDLEVPREVRILLIAADAASNRGEWARASELREKARKLTADRVE